MNGSPSTEIVIRTAVADDAPLLGAMRAAQQGELKRGVDEALARFRAASTAFFARELAVAEPWVFAWIAEAAGEPAGCAVLAFAPTLPRYDAGDGPDGRIRNVYVAPALRRRGIARALVGRAVAFAGERGVARLSLGASEAGRGVYASLGFVAKADEMLYRL